MDKARFASECSALGLNLGDSQIDAFESFESNLYARNEVVNLTRVPREECRTRHFIDSLLFSDLIPEGSAVLDIGTGPGFPAWPLACARPDLRIVALDSSGKMLGFLRENPLPNLKVVQARAEEWEMRDSFDVVTGRAVAPLAVQLELSAPLCKLGGLVIPMRSATERAQFEADAAALGLSLELVVERPLAGTDIVRLFPLYRKLKATPKRYPRSWAEMKRKPMF